MEFKKLLFLSYYTLLTNCFAFCNIFPANNLALNYTQIMFEINEVSNCNEYIIEIRNQKNNNLIFTRKIRSLATIISDKLDFGNTYSWRYHGLKNNKKIYTSEKFKFQITKIARITDSTLKINITKQLKNNNENEIIFLDKPAIAINRKGKPIWVLAEKTDSIYLKNYRNLSLTNDGTIMYLNADGAYEIDLNSNRKWEIRNSNIKDTIIKYHHDIQKLNMSTYLICKSEQIKKERIYNSLVLINSLNQVIWEWNEKNANQKDEVFNNSKLSTGTHLNGFAISKTDTNIIFLSFKNLSKIISLNKKSLTFNVISNQLNISNQHGPYINSKNELIIYNNNLKAETDEAKENEIMNPEVLVLDLLKNNTLIKKFTISHDSFPNGIQGKEGYAMTTNGENVLITAGGTNYIAEYNKNDTTVWEAFFYNFNFKSKKWDALSNYRTHYYSSLYPRYFTVQTQLLNNNHSIKINNDGTDDDTYEILIDSKQSKLIKEIFIKSGNSNLFVIPKSINKIIVRPKGITGLEKRIILK